MENPKLSRGQEVYLDFIRGLAAMTVLFGHASLLFLDDGWLSEANLQSAAVFVFFLLSGFLITYSTVRKYDDPAYGFKEYFIDRFSRIYCAFLPALFFVWLLDSVSIDFPLSKISPERLKELTWIADLQQNFNIPTWIGNLLMLQDFPLFQVVRRLFETDSRWFVDEFGSASPFWTISIEWWIYMAFGSVVFFLVRDKRPLSWWQYGVFGFLAIVPAYYSVGGPDNCLTFLWLMGMGVCLLFLKIPHVIQKPKICFVLFVVSVVFMVGRLVSLKFDYGTILFQELQFSVFLATALFSLLFFLRNIEKIPVFFEKFCDFIAGYSFSLYLTHASVLTYLYLRYPGNDNSAEFFWAGVLLSNATAIIFWIFFERHYRVVARKIKEGRIPEILNRFISQGR